MTAPVVAFFAVLVLCTSFIAGVFGMAGGMILMGGLLLILPVANAMVLHGITQLASNGWRAVLWRAHVRWRIVLRYAAGLLASAGLFSLVSFVPDQRLVFVFLGLVPFIPFLVPDRHVPRATARGGAESCGFICTSMQIRFGRVGGRRWISISSTPTSGERSIVATKACCQVVTHIAKIVYFGAVLTATEAEGLSMTVVAVAIAAAITGTTLARPFWSASAITVSGTTRATSIMAIGIVYLVKGASGYL